MLKQETQQSFMSLMSEKESIEKSSKWKQEYPIEQKQTFANITQQNDYFKILSTDLYNVEHGFCVI